MSEHPNATLVARRHIIHTVYLIYSLTSLLVTTYWAYSLYLSLLALFAIPHTGGRIPLLLVSPKSFSRFPCSRVHANAYSFDPTHYSNLQLTRVRIPRHRYLNATFTLQSSMKRLTWYSSLISPVLSKPPWSSLMRSVPSFLPKCPNSLQWPTASKSSSV